VQGFVDSLGWVRLGEQAQDINAAQSREVMWGAGPALSLHLIEDPVSLNDYVMARGYDKGAVDALAQLAEGQLDVWKQDELLQAIDDAADEIEKARTVIRAGVGAPDEFDELFYAAITAAMADPSSAVREAALYATAYSPYAQYRGALEKVANTDRDENRRNDAQLLLESFGDQGVPDS
jgi:hypothetical protein